VTDIVDPDALARVEVKFPWLGDAGTDVRAWATLLTPYADNKQGFAVFPEVDTQVVVAFEAGDFHRPYVVGSCWNGKEASPVTPTRPNDKRTICTRSQSLLEFDDAAAGAKVTLATGGGHKVVLDDATSQIEITHSNGCRITFTPAGQIKIEANATVEVTVPAVNVHAASATFDGIVTCQSLIAQVGVVSPSYTPGAGNVW
jgi:uncharacterized protein involved in type VI secretion and phage assembly